MGAVGTGAVWVIRRVGGLEGARTHPTCPGGVIRRVGGLEGMYAPEVLARLVIRRVGGLEESQV